MEQNTQTLSDYRDRLDAAVTAFSLFICDLCPEARMDISFTRYDLSGHPKPANEGHLKTGQR